MPFSPKQLHSYLIFHCPKSSAAQKAQSRWKCEAKLPRVAEETPQAGTQGKTACFYFFGVRVEKKEMGNPIKMKMLYTASLTVISEQEFLTVYGISGLDGKTREDTVI